MDNYTNEQLINKYYRQLSAKEKLEESVGETEGELQNRALEVAKLHILLQYPGNEKYKEYAQNLKTHNLKISDNIVRIGKDVHRYDPDYWEFEDAAKSFPLSYLYGDWYERTLKIVEQRDQELEQKKIIQAQNEEQRLREERFKQFLLLQEEFDNEQ